MSFYITFKKKTLACGSQEYELNGTPVLKLGRVSGVNLPAFQSWVQDVSGG